MPRRNKSQASSTPPEIPPTLQLTENFPVGAYVFYRDPLDNGPRFSFFSNRLLQMLDITREELDADPMAVYRNLHPDDIGPFFRAAEEAARLQASFVDESRYLIRGETRWYRLESAARQLPDGLTVWDGAVIDVTERHKAEEDLAASREREKKREEEQRLKLSRKLQTSLKAAAVAHEINQPLSRILLQCRLALDDGRKRKRALQSLIQEAETVVSTIEKMKVLLRNVETSHQRVNLSLVVKNSLLQLKRPIVLHKITIEKNLPRRACMIHGDNVQLQLALTNILRNAVEALAESRSRRKREIHIAIESEEKKIALVIGDSGPGWPGGTLDEMLLASSKLSGSGIGLYIVKTAVLNHRGEIHIGRSPLGGAEFRLVFPREG